jgi:hypothetical protein
LISDNGGEFTSDEFLDLCEEVGIKSDLSIAYNMKQNGVAERKNQTIMEAMKAMIHNQYLPMYLWAEAAMTTVYIHNRIPHRVIENKTPDEMFSGDKPEVSHLRIFGCPIYVHIPKDKRKKLDLSVKKGTFVGYSDTSKAYILYIPDHQKIEISKDVTFDEDVSFHKSKHGPTEESHDKENGIPRAVETREVEAEECILKDHDMAKPQRPVENPTQKRILAWAQEAIKDVEIYGA